MSCGHSDHCCGGQPATRSVHQSLDELDFDRGIWSAALYGDLERVRSLIYRNPDCVNKEDKSGYTALHYAARAGYATVCKELIQAGSDVNKTLRSGDTALHRAAFNGHTAVVVLLLESGAKPTAGDMGKTPLHKAAEQGKVDVGQILLDSFPQLITVTDLRGKTALEYAQKLASVESREGWMQLILKS